jgi:ribosome-associated toxin RatA of RatAB toxin-antitoxin module
MTSSTIKPGTVSTTHTIFVAAPPRVVYDLIADYRRWPYVFASTVHVERLAGGATDERLRLWSVSNGAVRNSVSRRILDPDGLRIRFRQETPSAPVATLSGEWVLVPLPDNATSVVLLHDFRAIGDDPGSTALIKQTVDRNSTAELAALKSTAELGERLPTLVHSFADSVSIETPPAPVYDFLHRVRDWPLRLPHVSRLIVDEIVPNVQNVEMEARGADGQLRTTRCVRVCFPHHSIVYKRTDLPEFVSAHVGAWHLYPTVNGVRLTSNHTVMLRPEKLRGVLGADITAERARELIRQFLGDHGTATLRHVRSFAQDPAGVLAAATSPLPGTP